MAPGGVSNGALQAQLDALKETMSTGLIDIKALVGSSMNAIQVIDQRVQQLEKSEAGCHPILSSRIDAAWKRIDEHTIVLKQIEDATKEMAHTNAILKWILGLFTALITAGIIMIATRMWQVMWP